MANLYQKSFTGGIPPLEITKTTGSFFEYQRSNLEPVPYQEITILKWRDIARSHVPVNADLSSCEFELKLEYFQIDYNLPSLTVVPSANIPKASRGDSAIEKQVKTAEFRSKYNYLSGHAKEIRLIRNYDSDYQITSNVYNSPPSRDIGLGYPITENLYYNRLAGFFSLLSYLIREGTLVFGNIKEETVLQIIPKLGDNDSIVLSGGYSGTVTYQLDNNLQLTKNERLSVGVEGIEVLPFNPKRYGFYITNNGTSDCYFNFGSNPETDLRLTLKSKQTLIHENNSLFIEGVRQPIEAVDNRYRLGLPLWIRSASGTNFVSVQELSTP